MSGKPQGPAPAIAVSTWSLHRRLGITYPNGPANDGPPVATPTYGTGSLALLDLPAEIAAQGIAKVEVCHFHVPGRDPERLSELRAALDDAGVELMTLLIDDGDITDAAKRDRDLAWIGEWIDAAARLGAGRARVIAGRQPPSPEVLKMSVDGLRLLAKRGRDAGVEIITENWLALMAGPHEVHHVLDALDGSVGFLADFGNWSGPSKYDDLASILARAGSTHAKGTFDETMMLDAEDFGRCLAAADAAGFSGTHSLVYDSPGEDQWAGILAERDFIVRHAAERAAAAA